jgi:hypothetical protein
VTSAEAGAEASKKSGKGKGKKAMKKTRKIEEKTAFNFYRSNVRKMEKALKLSI